MTAIFQNSNGKARYAVPKNILATVRATRGSDAITNHASSWAKKRPEHAFLSISSTFTQ